MQAGANKTIGTCALRISLGVILSFALLAAAYAQIPKQTATEEPTFEIRRFIFDGAANLPIKLLEDVTRPFTGKTRRFGDVQQALEALEQVYSEKGFNAVRVILPEQELERGEVRFQIVEARIERIVVEGNKFFDEANIRASVPSLVVGQSPNIRDIARNLRVANENSAKQINVLIRSGYGEATVEPVIRVVDEPYSRASVTVDNSGTQQTGMFRTGFGYQHSNMFNRDQQLTLQYVTSPNDAANTNSLSVLPSKRVFILGSGYVIPLYAAGDALELLAGYSNVNSGSAGSLFSVAGAGGIAGMRYTRNLDKIGDYEHRITASIDYRGYHNKGVRVIGGTDQIVRDIMVHPVGLQYSGQWRRGDTETSVSFGGSQNWSGGNDGTDAAFCAPQPSGAPPIRVSGSGECASPKYLVWRWAINHIQALAGEWQTRIALNGQLTRDMLVPGEQFGLGGADSVRGFRLREIANDNGYRGSFEVYTPDFGTKMGLAGSRARGLIFADWGGVRRNRPAAGEVHAEHVGAFGIGIRVSSGTKLTFRADYARVWDPGGSQGRGDGLVQASLSYIF